MAHDVRRSLVGQVPGFDCHFNPAVRNVRLISYKNYFADVQSDLDCPGSIARWMEKNCLSSPSLMRPQSAKGN